MSAATKRDAIDAAMSLAEDVAEGKVDPASLDQDVADECRKLFGSVAGEGDPLWPLHIDVARQALALGALSADELSEWLAVARSRAGEMISGPQPPVDLLSAASSASGPLSPEVGFSERDLSDDPEPGQQAEDDPGRAADAECGCGTTSPKVVTTADGRRIPSRLIIARGRGLPDPSYLV